MDPVINVLILSAGRRVELVGCFKKAAKELNISGSVVAVDCSETAPALYFADKHRLVPRIDSGRYVEAVIDVCNEENISLIVPTIDTELILLAENKDRIENETNARLLVSDISVINICRNKLNTQRYMEEHGFKVPKLYTEDELNDPDLNFPLFVKPVDGSSSIDAYKVNDRKELDAVLTLVKKPMVQDYMEGEEYTIDVFLDFDSNLITMVPRLRIAVRSGEIAKGRIVKDKEILEDVTRLMNELKPVGHITVQCRKTHRGIEYIEVNPRFGGGAPMSIMAGADSCSNLYRLLRGEVLTYNENYRDNVTFLRFDSSIMLNEDMVPEYEEGSSI
ncbi:MAG: ATP-grasp domain-containing protein [Lachnospiraceae bacterium]|nr:ATP-grasp domain-containing protein [Lachnospiraceae bacterium]